MSNDTFYYVVLARVSGCGAWAPRGVVTDQHPEGES